MPALISIFAGAAAALSMAWGLGTAVTGRRGPPFEISLGVGTVIESLLVFALLAAGAAHWAVFAALAAGAVAAGWWRAGTPRFKVGYRWAWLLAPYYLYYLVNALAPEITPDGAGYHLGLAAEYTRLGGFPSRIDFFGMTPQGLEMLYTVAFAIGRHSAAKLVHFAFLAATVPLMLGIGRKLELPDSCSLAAAALFVCSPLAGITGASTYTDAAQVFFTLAAFWLLLEWRETGARGHLLWAGLLAGFCYSIKITGLLVPALALLYAMRARRGAWLVAAGAALAIAPWMLRNAVLTGNPLAPLGNAWFPNPYFHVATERTLGASLRALGDVRWWQVPWQLCCGGLLQGIAGPAFLASPLALLAARKPAGRLLLAAAAVLAVPWFWNTGARFVMPALPFIALALVMALPRPLAWTIAAVQAVLCWPAIVDLWEPVPLFRLREFPIEAALRIETEHDYLFRHNDEYKLARMVEENVPPGARVLALCPLATAYTTRDVRVYWQSAETDVMLDTLCVAGRYQNDPLYDVRGSWAEQPLGAIRVRVPNAHFAEWCVHELRLLRGEDTIHPSPQWTLRGWPNAAEIPLALDGNRATRWRTWEPVRAGMYLEMEFQHSQILDGAVLLSHTPVFGTVVEFWGRGADRRWRYLAAGRASERPKEDLRHSAMRAVKQAGYGYILTPAGHRGNGPVGAVIAAAEAEWGVRRVARAGDVYLFRLQ